MVAPQFLNIKVRNLEEIIYFHHTNHEQHVNVGYLANLCLIIFVNFNNIQLLMTVYDLEITS